MFLLCSSAVTPWPSRGTCWCPTWLEKLRFLLRYGELKFAEARPTLPIKSRHKSVFNELKRVSVLFTQVGRIKALVSLIPDFAEKDLLYSYLMKCHCKNTHACAHTHTCAGTLTIHGACVQSYRGWNTCPLMS